MRKDTSRRDMMRAVGLGAGALAAAEMGGTRPAGAEEAFTRRQCDLQRESPPPCPPPLSSP
jgi:hypothetical protein